MEISETKNGLVVTLSLKGRLDARTSKLLEETLLGLINEANERLFVIDFQGLEYISSAGLRVLLVAAKGLKSKNGKIVLAALNDHLQKVFDITGFQGIFPIYKNVEEAMNNIS